MSDSSSDADRTIGLQLSENRGAIPRLGLHRADPDVPILKEAKAEYAKLK